MSTATKSLSEYRAKRNFRKTPEPEAKGARPGRQPIFVVQEHHASHLHYDFRLEADGVLKSWAVPKGPSMDPADKRLAVRVEDHSLAYAGFSGDIPEGQYGAGHVDIWDHGTFEVPPEKRQTLSQQIDAGHVEVDLHGEKLRGRFALVRMAGRRGGKENWLLIKKKDAFARPGEASAPKEAAPRKATAVKPTAPWNKAPAANGKPADVELTNGDKVWFPESGITKGDVFRYYQKVADRLLPFLRDRPTTLERVPDGIGEGAPHFWQKNTPAYYPGWVRRVRLETERGKPVEYALVDSEQALLYLVNQGTVTFHPWMSRLNDLDRPDFVLFDLDPGEAGFPAAVGVARALRDVLDAEGVESYAKTSGKSGLHVLVAWNDEGGFDEARAWAQEIAGRIAESLPEQATVEVRKAKRHGRVYIDTLQNARGHHAVPPYVVRAVAGAPVSMPLAWSELKSNLSPDRFTMKTAPARLARQRTDPIAGLIESFAAER